MPRSTFISAAAVVVALGLSACGGDAGDSASAAASQGDLTRYCALVKTLDGAGEKLFAPLGQDASAAEYKAAERQFNERYAGQLTELARVAPAAIRDDVGTVLDAGRQRAGLPVDEKVSEADASAADERVLAFEEDRCAS